MLAGIGHMNQHSPPAGKVAAYVRAVLDELQISQAELVRRVSARVGHAYNPSVAKGWLAKGNAPGDVVFALYEESGVSLDLFAGMRERQPSTAERLAGLERKYEMLAVDLEQLRRETGQPFEDRDVNDPDQFAAQGE